jgi:uncharacterized protein YkwD
MTYAMPSRPTLPPIRSFMRLTAAAVVALAIFAVSAPKAHACSGERSKSRAAAARAMGCLVNQERAKRGLHALRYDGRLAKVARVHAKHMVRYSFTGHNSPKSGGLVQRVKRARAVSRKRRFWVGENLGWGGTAGLINRMWMRSAIHRKATLYRKFTRMGVGVVRGVPGASRTRGLTYVVTFAG